EVRLEAYAVDRHTAQLEVTDHVVDGLRLCPGPVVDVVVVVAQLCGWVGGAGGVERDLDPVVASALKVGITARTAVAVGEGLVDNIPGVDLPPVVAHDTIDVVDHGVAQRAAAKVL